MKKLIFMIFVLFLSAQMVAQDSVSTQPAATTTTTTTTSAQDAEAPRRFGIYAGANFANINGNDEFDESATGFNVGLMWCVLSTGGLLSVWLEPGYNQIGSKYNDGTSSGTAKLGYIMLPIMARLQTNIGLYGEIGVQTQLMVSAKKGSADFKDDLNDFDWGVPLGLGFEFRKRLGISARYYFGFADITDDSSIDSNDKNNVISLRLHLRL